MLGGALGYLLWRGRIGWTFVAAAALAFALTAAPYMIYVWQYGSPTTQIALLQDGARAAG